MPDSNPLLQRWTLPPWSTVRAEHLVPAITTIVANNQLIIEQVIASQTEHPNWDDLILAVDEADATLAEAMAVIEYLSMGKSADSAWEKASAQCSQIAGQYRIDKLASVPLFRTFQRLENSGSPSISMLHAKRHWPKSCAGCACPELSYRRCNRRNSPV